MASNAENNAMNALLEALWSGKCNWSSHETCIVKPNENNALQNKTKQNKTWRMWLILLPFKICGDMYFPVKFQDDVNTVRSRHNTANFNHKLSI